MTELAATQNNAGKIFAKLITYIFHPLFIPTYIFFWVLLRFHIQFAGITQQALFFRKINVFWMTAFFPAFSVFLLWRLKFVDNIFLRTQKERIIPYIISMFFYWWMWYLSRNFEDQPEILRSFYFGIFIATVPALIINNFIKVSMHAMAIGSAFACILLTCFFYKTNLGADISIAAIITGAVCTARLLLNNHTNKEIYTGLFIGITSQLLAYNFVL